jgi:hypothetical protein
VSLRPPARQHLFAVYSLRISWKLLSRRGVFQASDPEAFCIIARKLCEYRGLSQGGRLRATVSCFKQSRVISPGRKMAHAEAYVISFGDLSL